jgi:DNA mismatch repair protein MutL
MHPGGRTIMATAGMVEDDAPAASPVGTTVTVNDLFFNLPARREFQRSPVGEARAIAHLITQLALATPAIRWRLVIDGREALTTAGTGSLREVMVAVYGRNIGPHLLELSPHRPTETDDSGGSLSVSGVTSSPAVHRNTRTQCVFVVNGRVIRSQSLSHAADEAYRAMLPHGRHPVATICLTVDPADVDVNVHPTKLEVRLRRERMAYARVRDAVRRALESEANDTAISPSVPTWADQNDGAILAPTVRPPRADFWLPTTALSRVAIPEERAGPLTGTGTEDELGPLVGLPGAPPANVAPSIPPLGMPQRDGFPARAHESSRDQRAPTTGNRASDLSSWRPLGQVGLTYVVVEAPDGMYLIDQHSAHERVQYEALKRVEQRIEPLHRQPLLVPEVLELTASQGAWLRGNVDLLSQLGYDLEPFSARAAAQDARTVPTCASDAWLLRAVPWAVAARARGSDVAALIDGLIEREYGDGPVEDQARWAVACHSSVRAGDHLTMPEMQALVAQLSACDLRLTCPHGRPTMIHLSHSQLAREFGRTSPVRSV